MRSRLLALGALAVALAAPHPAHAATFTAAFSPIRVNARPGDVVTTQVQLTLGAGPKSLHFRAHMEDWWRAADGLTTYYRPAGTLRRSCAPWIGLDPAEQEVFPTGRLRVRVTLSVPPDAAPGGYWCAVTINELPDPTHVAKATGVSFLASISTGVYVYIAPLERDAAITDIRVDGDDVQLALRSQGNTPMHASGTVELRRRGDETVVATVELSRGVLLPEPIGATILHGKLPGADALPDGIYRARGVIDVGLEHYLGAEKAVRVTRDAIPPAP